MWSLIFWFLILAATCILVKAEYSCFSSSSSEAKSIMTVYDAGQDDGDFWYGNNSPLVPCNFSSIHSSSSKCSVCLDDSVRPETVLVVLCNLTSGVELVFEGPRGQINFNKTDCPRPEPISVSKPGIYKPINRRGRFGIYSSLACIGALIITILVWSAFKCYKSRPTAGEEPNNVSYDPPSHSVRINMPGNGHVG